MTRAGYELKRSVAALLAQTDVVVVGRLTNVEEWAVDEVDYGEGTIVVTEILSGTLPKDQKVSLRWANRRDTTGRLDFEETGKVEFIWLLWRANDGTFRVRSSGQKLPLDQKAHIVESIEERNAQRGNTSDGDKQ